MLNILKIFKYTLNYSTKKNQSDKDVCTKSIFKTIEKKGQQWQDKYETMYLSKLKN